MVAPTHTVLGGMLSRRFLLSAWPWRSVAYLATTVPVATVAAVPLAVLAAPWALLLRRLIDGSWRPVDAIVEFVLGAVLVGAFGPFVAAPLARVERLRLRLVDGRPVASIRRHPSTGVRSWLANWYGRPTWPALAYAVVLVTAVPVMYGAVFFVLLLIGVCAASPWLVSDGPIVFGSAPINSAGQAVPYAVGGWLALLAVPYLLALTAGAHGAIARALLRTDEDEALRAELTEVARSRARLVDAFEAERRRIERDLHDGAQQKLVGLTLQLGLAKLDLPNGSPAAGAVATAHDQAKELMGELRELIHGIRPQVLADLGLPAGLQELAGRAGPPVDLRVDLHRRLPDHVEATAYFVVAEALTNVAKHSGATAVTVTAREEHGRLAVEVVDNGHGGADPGLGTGLTGLSDRVAVAAGRLLLSSPPGGPTTVRVELPC